MFSFKKLLEEKNRPLVMGILNITPDSFSDGGKYFSFESIIEGFNMFQEQGADIIDIGACSTAPCNELASEADELQRLAVLPELMKYARVPVSIDTFRPAVAKYALECGVSIVNDESGEFSREMAELVKSYSAGWIVMHTGGGSSSEALKYADGVTADVLTFFGEMREKVVSFGIDEECLCYDFGIGFGKSRDADRELLKNCARISSEFRLLAGASRKRIIGEITGEEKPENRIAGSVTAAGIMAFQGVSIIRAHDVSETVDAVKIAVALR